MTIREREIWEKEIKREIIENFFLRIAFYITIFYENTASYLSIQLHNEISLTNKNKFGSSWINPGAMFLRIFTVAFFLF